MNIVKIDGVVKEYAWGDKDIIPSLIGIERDGKPKAEYWMGTHPAGCATLAGGESLAGYSGTLPYLFKVLAFSQPLSLQCHPDSEQAKEGWKREEEYRKQEADSALWNYKDDNRKAEILYALTPVTAMCGFREFDEIKTTFEKMFDFDRYFGSCDDLKSLFTELYTMEQERRDEMLAGYLEFLSASDEPEMVGEYYTPRGIVMSVKDLYPGDPGLLAPYLLNVIRLKPGETIYLKPTTLHAYVHGSGLELMTASDNVLRGGLTKKKMDVPELISLLDFTPSSGECCEERKEDDGRVRILSPTPEFALYRMDSGEYEVKNSSGEILFCTSGSARVDGVEIAAGDCYFRKGSEKPYHVEVSGRLFSATEGR